MANLKSPPTRIVSVFLLLCLTFTALSQDVEQLLKAKPLEVGGALNFQYSNYQSSNASSFPRSAYRLTGSPVLTIYGIAVPITIVYSNQNLSYRQPMNQLGISPSYKWITLHAGYRNLHYSKYTLAGHTVYGLGMELKPDNWEIALSRGRLNKATQLDTTNAVLTPISFSRSMTSGMATYHFRGGEAGFSFIKAKDDPNSVSESDQFASYQLDTAQGLSGQSAKSVRPGDNLAVSFKFVSPKFMGFSVQGETAASYYTEDVSSDIGLSEKDVLNAKGISPFIGKLIEANLSTAAYYAYEGRLNYSPVKSLSTFFTYRRVDPGYQSMGAYFFGNDIEQMSLGLNTSFFKRKLRFAGSIGQQRNNLNNIKTSTAKRAVGSANVSYSANNWGVNVNYNSFDMNQAPRVNLIGGALKVTQTSKRFMVSPRYSWGDTSRFHSINLVISQNFMKSFLGEVSNAAETRDLQTRVYSINFSGSIFRSSWNYYVGPNYTQMITGDSVQYGALGITAGTQRSFLKQKLNASLNAGLYSTQQGSDNSVTTNVNVAVSYPLIKKLHAGLNLMFNNAPSDNPLLNNRELRSLFNLSYRF